MGQTSQEISKYMGTIPMTAGVVGSFLGGLISDRIAKKGTLKLDLFFDSFKFETDLKISS